MGKKYVRKSPLWRVKNPEAYRKWRKGYDKRWRKKNIRRLAPIWRKQERLRVQRKSALKRIILPKCEECQAVIIYSYLRGDKRFCGRFCEWEFYRVRPGEMPRRENHSWTARVEKEIVRLIVGGEL